ncbi:SRPBCC family protein [Nocardioides pyridinolyticus]
MLIRNDFEVGQPVDKVWAFFGDVPQVAACLPGARLNDDLGDDTYGGEVAIRMGPVKLEFDGRARIVERDDATKRMVIDASGADRKGRGQAAMTVTAQLTPAGAGTQVHLEQDLQLSGAAAQYGRGMISDVTTVLMGQFADNAQTRIAALERGESVTATATPASGLSIGLQAARMALMRVFRRFFLPYQPNPS